MGLPWILSMPIFSFLVGNIKLWGIEKSPCIESQLPVVIFSHGIGGFRTTYSSICTELASHGALVVAVEHRDGSASFTMTNQTESLPYQKPPPSGTEAEYTFRHNQLLYRYSEIQCILDLLDSLNSSSSPLPNIYISPSDKPVPNFHMDLSKLHIMGHSFGAATGFYAISQEPRFCSVVALDPWMKPLPQNPQFSNRAFPALIINSDTFHWKSNLLALDRFMSRNKELGGRGMLLTIKGTGHHDQSDIPSALPGVLIKRPENATEKHLVLQINCQLILIFFKECITEERDKYDPWRKAELVKNPLIKINFEID
jgi:platelet-activating factor acetylhydrolase